MEERLHLKGLNGLRAIAAISVVISHIRLPDITYNHYWPNWLGYYAVTIFFALSGFLITYLLLAEKKKAIINVKHFYIRRILRIWPLYFTYLIAAVLVLYFKHNAHLRQDLPFYIFFAANVPNIIGAGMPYLGHYWSLGVEEQFYLFWPWLIKKPLNILKAMLIFLFLFLALKLVFRYLYLHYGYFIPLNALVHTRFDCMAIGGIGAYLCFTRNRLFLQLVVNRITELVCWCCMILIAINKFRVTPFLDHDLVALMTVGLITNLSFALKPLIKLESRWFQSGGRISYGIYVVHPLVLYGVSQLLSLYSFSKFWETILFTTGSLGFTILTAWLSYEFLEKRFLHIKEKYTLVKNTA